MFYTVALGAKIKKKLRDNGIKQAWFADQMGVSGTRLSLILDGHQEITAKNLDDINRILTERGLPSDYKLPKKKNAA